VDIVTDHDGNLELRIAGATKRDSGTYALRVSNDTGTIESRCDVGVVERKRDDRAGTEQISSTVDLSVHTRLRTRGFGVLRVCDVLVCIESLLTCKRAV